RLRVLLLLLSLPLSPMAFASEPEEPEEGAVVEEVTKGWAPVGMRSGDLLLSWSRGEESNGPVRSPFDLDQIFIEQAPLGRITLRGTGEGESRKWALPPGGWIIQARPTLPKALLALYEQGRDQIAAGNLEEGAGSLRAAVEAAERQQNRLRTSWLQAR